MIAFVELVEVDEVGICLLGPASRRLVELPRKDADGRRNSDALGIEEIERVLPIEPTRRDSGVRHPGEGDVVEDLVSGQAADWLTPERAGDVLKAVRVVVEHPR